GPRPQCPAYHQGRAGAILDRASAAQVARLRRTVTKKGKKTVEVVYLITSDRDADPATLAAWVRSHSEIENRLHWVRDVTYQEDNSRFAQLELDLLLGVTGEGFDFEVQALSLSRARDEVVTIAVGSDIAAEGNVPVSGHPLDTGIVSFEPAPGDHFADEAD